MVAVETYQQGDVPLNLLHDALGHIGTVSISQQRFMTQDEEQTFPCQLIKVRFVCCGI